ncbi:MAG: DUF4381 domain-containing protein [Gammaproteobacteria bacterium]|nr:DUF4381 domain-containing protein [Gammaproteobacteria bacterium]NNJ73401.1 DUF4381 domain-containing protein [Enterobacterales bacterium]
MTAGNPLANLRDIHLPEQISWWPIAPGWWLLIILSLITIIWLGYKLRQRHQFRNTYRYCQAELATIDQIYQNTNDARAVLSEYSQLLRRLLILRLGRQHVASQTGKELLATLEEYALTEKLTEEHKALLIDGPYRKDLDITDYSEFKQAMDTTLVSLSLLKVGGQNHA